MPFEAPKNYDLSQEEDIAKLKKDLTPEEQQALDEYLEREKQAIIYLTQKELGELKGILSEDISDQHDADFDEFIEAQKVEGISTEDFLSHVEGIPEGVSEIGEHMDAIAHEKLFGNDGVMKAIELSPRAQDNISMGLSITVLQEIALIEDFSVENIEEKFDDSTEKLDIIEQSFKNTEPQIRGEGEANYVFMDVVEGNKFFSQIFEGKITSANIKGYIEERNLPEGNDTQITHRITGIQELVDSQNIQDLFKRLSGQETPNAPRDENNKDGIDTGLPDDIPTDPEERNKYIEQLKEGNFMEQMFAVIIEVLENLGLYSDEKIEGEDSTESTDGGEDKTGNDTPEEQSNISNITELLETLEGNSKIFGGKKEELIKELQGNPNLASRMQSLLEGISPNETFIESFQDLGLLEKGINIADTFREYGLDSSLPEGTSLGERVVKYIEEYARYRNSEGIRGLSSDRTTWKEYAQQRQSENWAVGGK